MASKPTDALFCSENVTEIKYKLELDIVEERTTIIDEIRRDNGGSNWSAGSQSSTHRVEAIAT